MSLLQRFEAFIKTMRGFESIDDLLRGVQLDGKKRADYLLSERKIIIEQKVLVVDQAEKLQKLMNQLMKQRGLLVFGTVSSRVIFDKLPDGDELQRNMASDITKGIEDSVAYADKQTRDTREIFTLPDALGCVVILNESAPTLDFDLMRYALHQVLNKRKADGSARYPHNDGVILISEAHAIVSPEGRAAPCFAAPTPSCKSRHDVRAFADELVHKWSAFNQRPLVHVSQIPPRR